MFNRIVVPSVKASEKTVYNQEKWTTKNSWYFTSQKIKYTSNSTKHFIPKFSSPYRNHQILIFKLHINVKIPSSKSEEGKSFLLLMHSSLQSVF